MAHMMIWPVWNSQVAMQGRKIGGAARVRSGIFGALGAVAPDPNSAPLPTDVVVDSLPANCPQCPPTISCAVCLPFSCPPLPPLSAGEQLSWHGWTNPATGKTMCVRKRAASDIAYLVFRKRGWEAHEVASAIVFGVSMIGIGIAVAYSRRHG